MIDLVELTKAIHKSTDVSYLDLFTPINKIVSDYKWKDVLEFGTGHGESGIAFLNNGCRLTTVEINSTCSRNSKITFFKFFPKSDVTLIVADDTNLPIIDRKWDVIFIDTSHEYTHTTIELEYCMNRTNFILMDDVVGYPDVNKSIHEFLGKHNDWNFHLPNGFRIGLLVKQ